MAQYRISGVPVTRGKLVGIITNRDIVFETNYERKISDVMTKENFSNSSRRNYFRGSLRNIKELIRLKNYL